CTLLHKDTSFSKKKCAPKTTNLSDARAVRAHLKTPSKSDEYELKRKRQTCSLVKTSK
ncbi:hypothetical protein L9F63_024079, partial [Diploptera punctata]